MLQDTKLAFIGTGVMAESMIKGILHEELITPDRIIGSDPHAARGQELVERTEFISQRTTARRLISARS